jgi:cold shock CspA family protein
MADKHCSISLVVNGQRWLEEGEALVAANAVPRAWSLCGLQDHVRITVGAKLGFAFDAIELVEQRWCRAKANSGDAEAVAAGFSVVTTPHVASSDVGAGLSLEAVDAAATTLCDVTVTVGNQMNWMPLRQKIEARGSELFELLLPPAGKVLVATERTVDLRELARQHHGDGEGQALFRPAPVVATDEVAGTANTAAAPVESLAANAARGTVKSLANGYGIITRRDGLGDVQFMATQVRPPGFDFIELGDELRFDVVQVSGGKWLAQRVVRI